MTPEQAYEQVCQIAKAHALIYQAAGGVVTIVHPTTQKEEGIYEHIQWVHGLGKHPKTLEQERAAEWHDVRNAGADAVPVTGSTPAAANQHELWPNVKVRGAPPPPPPTKARQPGPRHDG